MSAEISKAVPRVDGRAKAEGRSSYIADYPHDEMLTARFYRAPFSRGIIRSIKLPELPDGYYAVDFRDVPAANHIALIKNDLPAFAEKEIRYKGQIILIIAGPDPIKVDTILSEISVDYEAQTPVIGIDEAFACVGGPIHGRDNLYADLHLQRGDPDAAFKTAARIVEGEYSTGFQEQLYMEPQGLMAWTEKQGEKVVLQGSMQCPYYVKHSVEVVLGEGYDVQVIQTTTGGAFGGKEDYPEIMGAPLGGGGPQDRKTPADDL